MLTFTIGLLVGVALGAAFHSKLLGTVNEVRAEIAEHLREIKSRL